MGLATHTVLSGYGSQPITNAWLSHLRQQVTDCHQFQMARHHLELSILQVFVTMWFVWGISSWEPRGFLIHRDGKMHSIRWNEEGNKWRWLMLFRVWNEEILQQPPTALAVTWNEMLGLNALFWLAPSCKSPSCLLTWRQLWGQYLRESSQRFSAGLQLRGFTLLYTTG